MSMYSTRVLEKMSRNTRSTTGVQPMKPESPHNDYTVMEELLQVLSRPYDDPPEQGGYHLPPEPGGEAYKTFCGT